MDPACLGFGHDLAPWHSTYMPRESLDSLHALSSESLPDGRTPLRTRYHSKKATLLFTPFGRLVVPSRHQTSSMLTGTNCVCQLMHRPHVNRLLPGRLAEEAPLQESVEE